MKRQAVKVTVIVTALALLLGLAVSCGGDDDNSSSNAVTKSSEALLTSITVAGVVPESIPMPISSALWESEDFTDPEYTENIRLINAAALTNAPIVAQASPGATVTSGVGNGFDAPEAGFSAAPTLTFTDGQCLYVRVIAEDGRTTNYYRFIIQPRSSSASLRTLTIAGQSAELGNPATTGPNAISNPGFISLSNEQKTDARIVGTPSVATATVTYAFVAAENVDQQIPNASSGFSALETQTFADGDYLYVRVVSENGQNRNFYRVEIQIGRDATLREVLIGGLAATLEAQPQATWSRWQSANGSSYEAADRMPTAGFSVVVTTNDENATAVWALATDNTASATEPTTYGTATPIIFSNGTYLIIKVSSENGSLRYYRVRVIMKAWAPIYYGTPTLGVADSADPPVSGEIDTIWNDEAWLDVSRFNTAESYAAFFPNSPHTTARAKALWDNNGLWVYWDIDFMDYTDTQGNEQTRTAALSTGDIDMDNAHTRDSVELFVNERYQARTTGNWGSQYRVSANNAWLSGAAGNTPDGVNPIAIFQQSGKTRAWIKMTGAKQTGYVVIMQVPWIYKADPEANRVFETNGDIKVGAEIGLELQVNACSAVGTRDAILTWNGVTGQSYQNVRYFGIVSLEKRTP
jgi:hypothetical protein